MGPLVSRPSLVASVGRKAQHMSAPVGGTCTSSLLLMVNWRPLVSLPGITSHKIQSSKGLGNCQLFCEFELSGPEGFVESTQISGEGWALLTEAVDCRWYIKAPPRSRVCICQTVVGLMCWWWWCYVCLLFVAVTVWSVETDEGIKYYVHFHLLSQSADSRVWKYSTTSRLKAICIISRLYIHVYSISVFE